jgi:hypothetical protein
MSAVRAVIKLFTNHRSIGISRVEADQKPIHQKYWPMNITMTTNITASLITLLVVRNYTSLSETTHEQLKDKINHSMVSF